MSGWKQTFKTNQYNLINDLNGWQQEIDNHHSDVLQKLLKNNQLSQHKIQTTSYSKLPSLRTNNHQKNKSNIFKQVKNLKGQLCLNDRYNKKQSQSFFQLSSQLPQKKSHYLKPQRNKIIDPKITKDIQRKSIKTQIIKQQSSQRQINPIKASNELIWQYRKAQNTKILIKSKEIKFQADKQDSKKQIQLNDKHLSKKNNRNKQSSKFIENLYKNLSTKHQIKQFVLTQQKLELKNNKQPYFNDHQIFVHSPHKNMNNQFYTKFYKTGMLDKFQILQKKEIN